VSVDTLTTFRAVQRVLADITGMAVVHGVTPPTSGGGAHALLRPATDALSELPAIVLGSGPIEVTPGPVTRFRWTMRVAVWRSRTVLDEEYDGLVGDIGRIVVAVAARGKAYLIQAGLQSLTVPSFEAIDGAEWPAGSGRWYLVQPFELQIVAEELTAAGCPLLMMVVSPAIWT